MNFSATPNSTLPSISSSSRPTSRPASVQRGACTFHYRSWFDETSSLTSVQSTETLTAETVGTKGNIRPQSATQTTPRTFTDAIKKLAMCEREVATMRRELEQRTETYETDRIEWKLRLDEEREKNAELQQKVVELEEKAAAMSAQKRQLTTAMEELRETVAVLEGEDGEPISSPTPAEKPNVGSSRPHDLTRKISVGMDKTRATTLQKKINVLSALVDPLGRPAARPAAECAISLAWLQTFARDIDPTWSTYEVVQRVIIPQTQLTKRRFTEKLEPNHYSSPTFFVSHRWSDRFRELVETVSAYCLTSGLGDPAAVFLWIDIFAVNQHSGAAQKEDLDNLGKAITESKNGTLLVMDDRGGVLTRIWCLYEIHKTVQRVPGGDSSLIMLMPKDVDAAVMRDVWTSLDVEKAESTVLADRDRILAEIRASTVNTQSLNHKLKATLVKGSELQIQSARETLLTTLMRGAQLLQLAGRSVSARPLLEESIALFDTMPNHDSADTRLKLARCQDQLSDIIGSGLSRYEEALPLAEASLTTRRALLGESHIDLAESLSRLGWTYMRLHRYEEAESHMLEALNMRTKLFQGDHAHVAHSYSTYSTLQREIGNLEVALKYLNQAREMRGRLFGLQHPVYAGSLGNTVLLLIAMNRSEEAVPLAERAVAIRQHALGAEHPHTSDAHSWMSAALLEQKRIPEAYDHAMRCLNIRRSQLGRENKQTADAWLFLSRVHDKSGNIPAAIQHVDEAEKIYTSLATKEKVDECITLKANLGQKLDSDDPTMAMQRMSSTSNSLTWISSSS